jgi:hypothetical protein
VQKYDYVQRCPLDSASPGTDCQLRKRWTPDVNRRALN